MKFQAPSHIKDRELLWAAAVNNPNHLEDNLNAPRDPNFICSNHGTALYVASQHNSLACAVLLVEAKADLELGHPAMNMTPLFAAAGNGHLDLVRFWVERNASIDNKCRAQGATPLYRAAHKGPPFTTTDNWQWTTHATPTNPFLAGSTCTTATTKNTTTPSATCGFQSWPRNSTTSSTTPTPNSSQNRRPNQLLGDE